MAESLITGLRQVCIATRDFETTAQNLAGHFGIGPWKCWNFTPPKIFDTQKDGRAVAWTKKLGVAWVGALQLELIQSTSGPTIYEETIDRQGEGVQHLLVKTGTGYFDAIRQFEAAGYKTCQSARINPPMQVGPVTLPPLPTFLANRFALQYVYHDTESDLGVFLETSKMPPGISFHLGVELGKPDFVVEAGSAPAPISAIHTIGILTDDLEGTCNWWEALGVGPWTARDLEGGRMRSAPLDGVTIDLVQPGDTGVYRAIREAHGPGAQYLGVSGAAPEAYAAAGCPVLAETTRGTFFDASTSAQTVLLV